MTNDGNTGNHQMDIDMQIWTQSAYIRYLNINVWTISYEHNLVELPHFIKCMWPGDCGICLQQNMIWQNCMYSLQMV